MIEKTLLSKNFVAKLSDLVIRNKNKGMNAIFEMEKIAKSFTPDIHNALMRGMYGTINQNLLQQTLHKIVLKNLSGKNSNTDLMSRISLLSSSYEQKSEPDKDGVKLTEDILPNNPSVLDPNTLQPGNIYHIDGTVGKITPGGKVGHSAIEIEPDQSGKRMVISSSPEHGGVYTQPLEDELRGKKFIVTKPPHVVNHKNMQAKVNSIIGVPSDYKQLTFRNAPDKLTCTETTCAISKAAGNTIDTHNTGRTLDPNEVYNEAVRQGHITIHRQDTPYAQASRKKPTRHTYPDSVSIYSNLYRSW